MASSQFRINNPPVVAETLDGEATIVDLESGTYYALNESGSFVWDELGRGLDAESIATSLAAAYDLPADQAKGAVEELIARLRDQNLIVPLDDGAPAAAEPAQTNGNRVSYTPPEMSTFTDMQELLLLDPVHEVDESGWPGRP